MDAMLKNSSDEDKFQEIFSGICDSLNIETLVPVTEENDISSMKTDFKSGYWQNEIKEVEICPQPFYLMVVSPEGIVLPCCSNNNVSGLDIGKISKENTIVDIWNGNRMKFIRQIMIEGKRHEHSICAKCDAVTEYLTAPEDNLDAYTKELQKKYE